jgi:hypothetical protein
MAHDIAWLGKASLRASIIGVVLPLALVTIGIVLLVFLPAHRAREVQLLTALGYDLGMILELAAIACGIAARRTATGRAGLVISGAVLLLFLAGGLVLLWLILVVSPALHYN